MFARSPLCDSRRCVPVSHTVYDCDVQAEIPSSAQWVRQAVVERLERHNVPRPQYNVHRQQRERQQQAQVYEVHLRVYA
jgi:hypothetical protein